MIWVTDKLTTSRAPIERSLVDEPVKTLVQASKRLCTARYLLPEKLEGKPVRFLLDTGFTTSLLSKQVFNRLAEQVKGYLEGSDSHGIIAERT